MAKTEEDSFENSVKRYGGFVKPTCTNLTRKEKKMLHVATLELQFGFNIKSDNFNKTNQLKLFEK